ncbi:MAG: hydrogenase iron-sulfur subunit [Chloroflexi bacterium]|nr:hydrogenase iron-sulfur subunit [Chloroflexota bacterium]
MNDGRRVVVMGCTHSAGEALKALRQKGQELPANVEWVELPCGGSVDELHILRALESGAEKVMVLACCDGACRSVEGSAWAEKRVQSVRAMLAEVGLPAERVTFYPMAPTMAADLWAWVQSR